METASTRHWLITSTTYGTWLPGDERGFVSTVKNDQTPRIRHNLPGTAYDCDIPQLRDSARALMKGLPVYLTSEQGIVVRDQFQETIAYRGWRCHALAIMANHFHIIVEAVADVHSTKILGDLKSYASRALNRRWARPNSGTWWTESGSRRPLSGEVALINAVIYVCTKQRDALVTWYAADYADSIKHAERGALAP